MPRTSSQCRSRGTNQGGSRVAIKGLETEPDRLTLVRRQHPDMVDRRLTRRLGNNPGVIHTKVVGVDPAHDGQFITRNIEIPHIDAATAPVELDSATGVTRCAPRCGGGEKRVIAIRTRVNHGSAGALEAIGNPEPIGWGQGGDNELRIGRVGAVALGVNSDKLIHIGRVRFQAEVREARCGGRQHGMVGAISAQHMAHHTSLVGARRPGQVDALCTRNGGEASWW